METTMIQPAKNIGTTNGKVVRVDKTYVIVKLLDGNQVLMGKAESRVVAVGNWVSATVQQRFDQPVMDPTTGKAKRDEAGKVIMQAIPDGGSTTSYLLTDVFETREALESDIQDWSSAAQSLEDAKLAGRLETVSKRNSLLEKYGLKSMAEVNSLLGLPA